ncbi:MAG: leucine--tRNA ligase [Acidobacteria bacterium]|nr:leucine--tRNA ligase [Acidobacteriota bacterium]
MREEYNFEEIENKWQSIWKSENVFSVKEDPGRKKYYCLEMYPYPSGKIHMGHVRNYAIGDVISRFKTMSGFNVLHPIGWDALGLPAENAAIKHGVHPKEWTLDNIAYMKKQLQRMGFNYDWSREVSTCLPEYYRWCQWIFLKLFEKEQAFRKKSWVNWCPSCSTVLANEQVISGLCWRCDAEADQKQMEQWYLKITDYAEELLSGHSRLSSWPEHVLAMQRNWIGKSTGAHVTFPVVGSSQTVEVFTTRIDTIFGATFLVLSPEHPLSADLIGDSADRDSHMAWIKRKIEEQRLSRDEGEAEKEGIDTGKKAVNPFTGEDIPIWIANYILMDYGTGAVMAVPAHDERDFEFAGKYGLSIRVVITPDGMVPKKEPEEATEAYGRLIQSGRFTGKSSRSAMEEMALFAEEQGFGSKSTLFRLRDWGISRQRYWGTPIPVIYCKDCGIVGVPYEELPVQLPSDVELKGEEGSPLARNESFVHTACPKCGGPARRETDTMDTFVDSSWYFFRYCSPGETGLPFQPEAAKYWMPVDLYIGGVEHAILHLIYSRYFCKVLRDLGLTDRDEPFPHYLPQGMVIKDGSAMSKSKGNVVDPDEMIRKYGADTLRIFILFASPPEKEFAWNEKGIEGSFRFLNRIWSFFQENADLFNEYEFNAAEGSEADETVRGLRTKMHQTIRKVTVDIDKRFHLNTAISSIMELLNRMKADRDCLRTSEMGRSALREAMEILIRMLSPFAPHLCEELWQKLGHQQILVHGEWPAFNPELAREETVTVVVQVNGKLRDKFEVERGTAEEEVKSRALKLERIQQILVGRTVRKVIYIQDKLVNIVA